MNAPFSLDEGRALPNAASMAPIFGLIVALACLSSAVSAQERPQGLLWHRSGKPATLPLHVKTDAGADYLLRLQDAETRRIVLAAYIRGGEFFQVLAPPGTYVVIFSSGKRWRGEVELFGKETQSFILNRPLTFGASVTRKNGHLIDLSGGGDAEVRDFALCQRLALDPRSLRRHRYPEEELHSGPNRRPSPRFKNILPRYELRSRVCD